MVRISMNADDAAIFLKPDKNEANAMADLLTLFGQASGLVTNFLKSTMVPIKCSNLNITNILQGLPAAQTHFPIKYLGLPLTTIRLR